MKRFLIFVVLLFAFRIHAGLAPMSIDEARKLIANPSQEIMDVLSTTPSEYSFYFENQNTVEYTGQVMRQVLTSDLKLRFNEYNRGQFGGDYGEALARYQTHYRFDPVVNGAQGFRVKAKKSSGGSFPIYEGFSYLDICPGCKVNLRQKIAGLEKDTPLLYGRLVGWNTPEIEGVSVDADQSGSISPDELMEALIQVLAQNASSAEPFEVPNGELESQKILGAHLTPNGLDIAQLAQKLIHSAVSFSQASADYLGISNPDGKKGLYGDNTTLRDAKPYTDLQHYWDEAFGYFGAARNYLEYSDVEIRKGFSIDSYYSSDVFDEQDNFVRIDQTHKSRINDDVDLNISLMAEKNLGMSLNAAKRDMGAVLGDQDFTKEIMEAFLRGRHLLQEKPEGYLPYAQAFSVIAISEWEKVLAATVIHYINKTLKDYDQYGTQDYKFTDLAKHFSEMKGFAFAFQFNPYSQMNIEDFTRMHELMGDFPVDPSTDKVASYRDQLAEARLLVENSFGFAPENVRKW